jgi:predicted thioredoxin/glutaredoxin
MNNTSKHYSISMSQMDLNFKDGTGVKTYPVMNISIEGAPSLSDIIHLVNEIKTAIKDVKEDYISVTDLSKLSINKFLGKIIMTSMESTYKSLLSVGRQSVISFVVFGETQEYTSLLDNTLRSINEQKIDTVKDYKYRYYFVKLKEDIKAIAEQILM